MVFPNGSKSKIIKKLVLVVMDERVGVRDMDCSEPGFVKADGTGRSIAFSNKA